MDHRRSTNRLFAFYPEGVGNGEARCRTMENFLVNETESAPVQDKKASVSSVQWLNEVKDSQGLKFRIYAMAEGGESQSISSNVDVSPPPPLPNSPIGSPATHMPNTSSPEIPSSLDVAPIAMDETVVTSQKAKEGLEVIGVAIEKMRDSVAYWAGTQKRLEKFEETARQLRTSIDIYHENSDFEVEKIIILCRKLVEQYEKKEQLNADGCTCGSETNVVAPELVKLNKFDLYASQKKRKPMRSELDIYLEEDILPRTADFDILSWWKSNKGKFPILHKIARDILAIPVSTVASESAFSTSGKIVSRHRSRLHENTVGALMCAQNWILAKLKDNLPEDHGRATDFDESDDEDGVEVSS